MIYQFRNKNFYFIVLSDMALFTASLFLAYAVRFTFSIPKSEIYKIYRILPWVITIKTVTFFILGVYKGMWRYTSVHDALQLAKASGLATLEIMAVLTVTTRFIGYSRAIFIADCIFTTFFCASTRLAIRVIYSLHKQSKQIEDKSVLYQRSKHRIRLLVIGAGDAATRVINEFQSNARSTYEPVCCVDDDPTKYGRNLLGIPVRGPIERLSRFVKEFNAGMILIAIPSVSGKRMREITTHCTSTGLPFKTLPSIHSFIDGRVSINSLRDVNYEDFLGRAPVKLDTGGIGKYITDKTILVTGGGGSIGSELCRQIMTFKPALLVLVDSSEYNLHQIELDLKLTHGTIAPLQPILGKVQDTPMMNWVFQKFRPAAVFHAAAYKHVPILESNPWEGIFTNVIGTWVTMQCAEKSGTERMVLVSTDKAVNPVSVLGATKRLTEVIMHSYNSSTTKFMTVRFGNVVGSSGSVIQVFERQIKMGGPVTITHPDITRYFMSIPEACQLILQAGALGNGKEIFVLQMGEPVKIVDMACDLIRLAGKEPYKDIEIIYTGLRPGEKLHEELIADGEKIAQTPHEKIMVLTSAIQTFSSSQIEKALTELVSVSQEFDRQKIRDSLKKYVPEYHPSVE